jgi:hypothetical protein
MTYAKPLPFQTLQTPGNNPEESIQHSKQGGSLKSRISKSVTLLSKHRALEPNYGSPTF